MFQLGLWQGCQKGSKATATLHSKASQTELFLCICVEVAHARLMLFAFY